MSREIINELREQLKIMNDKLDKLESSLEDKEKTDSLTFVLKKELINKPVYVSELYKIDSSSVNKKEPVLIKRSNILEDTRQPLAENLRNPLNKEFIKKYREEANSGNDVAIYASDYAIELLEKEAPLPTSISFKTLETLSELGYSFFKKLHIINLHALAYNHNKYKSAEEALIDILPDDSDYYIEYTITRKLTQAECDELNKTGNVVKISKKEINER